MSAITESPIMVGAIPSVRAPFPKQRTAPSAQPDEYAPTAIGNHELSGPFSARPNLIPDKTLGKAGLLLRAEKSSHRALEEIRLVQHRICSLLFPAEAGGPANGAKIVLVSGLEKESVSVSLNIAAGLARWSKKPTVLVDVSPAGSLTSSVELRGRLGFGELHDDATRLDDILWSTHVPNFEILPAGDLGATNDEGDPLSSRGDKGKIIANLRPAFPGRIIVLHAPPVLVYSDTATIAKHADAVVLVVEAGATTGGEITTALDVLGGHEKVGVVVNNVHFNGRGIFARKLLSDVVKRVGRTAGRK